MMRKIKKILCANRGEIVVRILSTCRELGIECVTVYADNDRDLPHALLSHEAYSLGSGKLSETYLNQDLLLEIARKAQVDAIHPGYGFLSENASFCQKVEKAGFIFIGPRAESIELMGDKKASKNKIAQLGVPLIPGYHGDMQEPKDLLSEAQKIGFPVLIKASAGGGGKGMRIVEDQAEFPSALASAKREALGAFGNDQMLIEKYLVRPRHIEVQVMSDECGNHLHFFERECSIQRRYQKIVEETPSPALDDALRKEITSAATKITRGINYRGAGTLEFILDENNKFYFLEMNTRLQVEHPVTEMTTGYDLVQLQILVGEGRPLEIKQEDIRQNGHAIEVRIYCEDPDNDFLPTAGVIEKIGQTELKNVRMDKGHDSGNTVSIDYDPMLAKIIAWSLDREGARKKMLEALRDFEFRGVKTNRDFLRRVLKVKDFVEGRTYTSFIKDNSEVLRPTLCSEEDVATLIAGVLLNQKTHSQGGNSGSAYNTQYGNSPAEKQDVWSQLSNFRNV